MEDQTKTSSLVLHVDNVLGRDRRQDIEHAIRERQGVHTAWFNSNRPHLMIVEYDTIRITFKEIMVNVSRQSVQAKRVA